MDELCQQIAVAAANGLYFLALAGALVIPDICGALGSPDGVASGALYRDWFDRWVAPLSGGIMTGDTCYQFRCSLLHQGTTQHPKSTYSRVIFLEPTPNSRLVLHLNIIDDALNIDVQRFCVDVVKGAFSWRQTVLGTEPYETNVRNFVTRYPEGLAPYILGVPVIS